MVVSRSATALLSRWLGKTTTTFNLAASLARQNRKVLAKAYKMRLYAIKSQGKRNVPISAHAVQKLGPDVIGDENSVSGETVRRYVRLNSLTPELLEKVDDKKLAFTSAVELSYVPQDKQNKLFDGLDTEEKYGVPLAVVSKLRAIETNGNLTKDKIEQLITTTINKKTKDYKVSYQSINKYFETDVTPKEVNETIDKALKL